MQTQTLCVNKALGMLVFPECFQCYIQSVVTVDSPGDTLSVTSPPLPVKQMGFSGNRTYKLQVTLETANHLEKNRGQSKRLVVDLFEG